MCCCEAGFFGSVEKRALFIMSEARVAKIEAEKQRRVDDKEREKKEHYWQGKLAGLFEVFFLVWTMLWWCCGGVVMF